MYWKRNTLNRNRDIAWDLLGKNPGNIWKRTNVLYLINYTINEFGTRWRKMIANQSLILFMASEESSFFVSSMSSVVGNSGRSWWTSTMVVLIFAKLCTFYICHLAEFNWISALRPQACSFLRHASCWLKTINTSNEIPIMGIIICIKEATRRDKRVLLIRLGLWYLWMCGVGTICIRRVWPKIGNWQFVRETINNHMMLIFYSVK